MSFMSLDVEMQMRLMREIKSTDPKIVTPDMYDCIPKAKVTAWNPEPEVFQNIKLSICIISVVDSFHCSLFST